MLERTESIWPNNSTGSLGVDRMDFPLCTLSFRTLKLKGVFQWYLLTMKPILRAHRQEST